MSSYPVLDNRPIDQWKVTELKDELRRRNLCIKGLKDDLVETLSEAFQGETSNGREETVGGTLPDNDVKEGETHGSADAPLYQASVENNIDKDPSEVATQECNLSISVTEAAKESVVATEHSLEAVPVTTEVSQETPVAVAEDCEARPVDVASTVESTLSDAVATKGVDLESIPYEIIAEKTPEDGIIKKMTAADVVLSDVASTDVKVDTVSAKDKFGAGVSCEILEQKAVSSPPDVIMSHAGPWNSDAVAATPKQNAERLIPKNNSGDNALTCSKYHKDSKCTNGDCNPILSEAKVQVSEVNPDLGSQIDCVSISHDNISTNEKNNIKDNLNADNSDLELEFKQEMVKPSSSIRSLGADLQALDGEKALPKNETPLQGIDSTTNMDLDLKEGSPDDGSRDKLNLDRNSGDESMEEDVIESKLADSNIKSDDLGGMAELTSEHMVKEAALLDSVAEVSSVHIKEAVAEEKPATATKKRKPEGLELVNNEQSKHQRRWNMDDVKIPEQQASKLNGSDASKTAVFRPALKRSFGRSSSTASGNSPKERTVPPPQGPTTTSLRIDGFVRPFTLKAVQELLGKTGSVCSFWMDHIKTHCYVTYPLVEEAVATRNAVYNLQWPPNNGNHLVAEFVDPQEVKLKLEPLPPSSAPIGPSTTTPKAALFQQSKANLIMPPLASGTSRGLLPTPQRHAMPLPISDPEPQRENLLRSASRGLLPTPQRHAMPPPISDPAPQRENPPTPSNFEPPAVTLENLFKRTQALPRIFYMPVSEEEVLARLTRQRKEAGRIGG